MFFTLLPVSALAEGSTHTGTNHVDRRTLDTDNKDDQGLTYTLHADHTATVASYDNSTPDGVIDIPDTVKKIISIIQSQPLETMRSVTPIHLPMFPAYLSRPR